MKRQSEKRSKVFVSERKEGRPGERKDKWILTLESKGKLTQTLNKSEGLS